MIVFASAGGTTRKVAQRMRAALPGDEMVDLARDGQPDTITGRCLLLLCPSYGDEELEEHFESFLLRVPRLACTSRLFAFCELGIYTGYEDFGHGLVPQVRAALAPTGLVEACPPLSIDSVPVRDWPLVERWAANLATRLGLPDE